MTTPIDIRTGKPLVEIPEHDRGMSSFLADQVRLGKEFKAVSCVVVFLNEGGDHVYASYVQAWHTDRMALVTELISENLKDTALDFLDMEDEEETAE